MLVLKNDPRMPAMDHNATPPFLMREASLIVDDVPKSKASAPTKKHHYTCFPDDNIIVPLLLHGVLSFLPSKKLSLEILNQNKNNVLVLTTSCVNPRSKTHA